MFLYWIFWRWKIQYFWAKKLMEIWYLLITEKFLFWSFREWEIRPFLRQKVAGKMIFTDYWKVLVLTFSRMGNTSFFWGKKLMENDIYWSLRSSCFELFGDGKYGLFSAKKLMERWYLLALFELPMIFQDLGNMVFRAVNFVVSRSLFRVKDSPNFWLPN